jgi:hypothetical protein
MKVVCNGLVSHSSLSHTQAQIILPKPWHRRSCENSNFQKGKFLLLLTAQLIIAGDINA